MGGKSSNIVQAETQLERIGSLDKGSNTENRLVID